MIGKFPALLALLILGTTPVIGCDLKISDAWIREAPPGLMTLAGYALLANEGNRALRIVKMRSPAFAEIQMHESVIEHGVASMRAISSLEIAAHQQTAFAPNGRHFMLMGATKPLKKGDIVTLRFQDQDGCTTAARFVVRSAIDDKE